MRSDAQLHSIAQLCRTLNTKLWLLNNIHLTQLFVLSSIFKYSAFHRYTYEFTSECVGKCELYEKQR